MAIIKIQEKLRRILGNTVRSVRTLASPHLPTFKDTVEAFMEASGIAFKCRYEAGAGGNFTAIAGSEHNPLGFTIGIVNGVSGLYSVNLSNPSSYETFDINRLAIRVQLENDDGFTPGYIAFAYISAVDNLGASRGITGGFKFAAGANAFEGQKITITLERW